ncbi:MAG: hypothetical protein RIQ68_2219 [Pseudomonadota bacterium]|jgi:uncharacterized membrane protein YhaH (DUF805 family)
MSAILSGEGFRFLFRTDKGVIARDVWWLGTALTGAVAFVATLIWFAIAPLAKHDLAERGLIDAATLSVHLYLAVYAFLILLTGVCWYNLTAKRFRAMGRAPAFAGLPLVLGLFAGAAHWVSPRLSEMVPQWSATAIDIALAFVIIWTLFECGFKTKASETE